MHTVGRERSDDADNLGGELTEEEIAKAQAAFEAKFTEVATAVMARVQTKQPESGTVSERLVRAAWSSLLGCGAGALAGVGAALEAIYEEPADVLLGPPREARAYRALFEQGDGRFFLRMFAEGRDHALADPWLLNSLPIEALEEEVAAEYDRVFGQDEVGGMTISEVKTWCEARVEGAYDAARFLVERRDAEELEDVVDGVRRGQVDAVSELSPADLLIYFAKIARPRGFAARNQRAYGRVKAIESRLQRRSQKFSSDVFE